MLGINDDPVETSTRNNFRRDIAAQGAP